MNFNIHGQNFEDPKLATSKNSIKTSSICKSRFFSPIWNSINSREKYFFVENTFPENKFGLRPRK